MGLANELRKKTSEVFQVKKYILDSLDYLGTSRPTAVTLFNAINQVKDKIKDVDDEKKLFEIVFYEAQFLLKQDEEDNEKISNYGYEYIAKDKESLQILTHCNTGALATSKYGTALGIIRKIAQERKLHVFATETR